MIFRFIFYSNDSLSYILKPTPNWWYINCWVANKFFWVRKHNSLGISKPNCCYTGKLLLYSFLEGLLLHIAKAKHYTIPQGFLCHFCENLHIYTFSVCIASRFWVFYLDFWYQLPQCCIYVLPPVFIGNSFNPFLYILLEAMPSGGNDSTF